MIFIFKIDGYVKCVQKIHIINKKKVETKVWPYNSNIGQLQFHKYAQFLSAQCSVLLYFIVFKTFQNQTRISEQIDRKCIYHQYRSIEHVIQLKKLQKIFNLSKRVMQISDPIFLLIYFFATSVSDRRYLFSCRGTLIQN